jgi:chromosomal replication initiation ATPase DnaA
MIPRKIIGTAAEKITAKVLRHYNLEDKVNQVFGSGRKECYVLVRHLIWYCLRHEGYTYKAIADWYRGASNSNADHSTIIHAYRKVQALAEARTPNGSPVYPEVAEIVTPKRKYSELQNKVRGLVLHASTEQLMAAERVLQ